MHIFLIGTANLIDRVFARAAFRRGHTLSYVTDDPGPATAEFKFAVQRDLADAPALTSLLLDAFPDAIVNCAEIADSARCESNPVRSHQINVALPTTLARLAHHLSAKLLHLSSDQVFDGVAAPFATSSETNPLNLYGRQKLLAEQSVHTSASEFAVTLRVPGLTGNSVGGRESLHERLFEAWAKGEAPLVFTDEIRQPCTAGNLAEVMLECLERNDLRGVFHWAGAETLSRATLAQRVRHHFKLEEASAPLRIASRREHPEIAAARQADLSLNLKPLAGLLKTPLESFDAQLEQLAIPPPAREWYFSCA